MLEYVAHKAEQEQLGNIECQHAGFLTMDFPEASFEAVVSGAALHHLPDAWKLPALQNIRRCLRDGGQFILRDVVFVAPDNNPTACFEQFVRSVPNAVRPGAIGHVAREYSTFDWIMEGLLQRAGFDILSTTQEHESFLVYHCRV